MNESRVEETIVPQVGIFKPTGGALKNDKLDNKAPLHQLRPEHIEEMCRVFQWAEDNKYPKQDNGDPNYMLGMAKHRLLGAALRHVLSDMTGEELDPESGLSHLGHAMCNLAMIKSMKKAGTLV